jgi:hypothetical protein
MITIKLAQESKHRNKQLRLFFFKTKKGAKAPFFIGCIL